MRNLRTNGKTDGQSQNSEVKSRTLVSGTTAGHWKGFTRADELYRALVAARDDYLIQLAALRAARATALMVKRVAVCQAEFLCERGVDVAAVFGQIGELPENVGGFTGLPGKALRSPPPDLLT